MSLTPWMRDLAGRVARNTWHILLPILTVAVTSQTHNLHWGGIIAAVTIGDVIVVIRGLAELRVPTTWPTWAQTIDRGAATFVSALAAALAADTFDPLHASWSAVISAALASAVLAMGHYAGPVVLDAIDQP